MPNHSQVEKRNSETLKVPTGQQTATKLHCKQLPVPGTACSCCIPYTVRHYSTELTLLPDEHRCFKRRTWLIVCIWKWDHSHQTRDYWDVWLWKGIALVSGFCSTHPVLGSVQSLNPEGTGEILKMKNSKSKISPSLHSSWQNPADQEQQHSLLLSNR